MNEVKVILKDNIDKVLERGDRLDDLIGKTGDLQASVSFGPLASVEFFGAKLTFFWSLVLRVPENLRVGSATHVGQKKISISF